MSTPKVIFGVTAQQDMPVPAPDIGVSINVKPRDEDGVYDMQMHGNMPVADLETLLATCLEFLHVWWRTEAPKHDAVSLGDRDPAFAEETWSPFTGPDWDAIDV